MRFSAVDWSGALHGERRAIWIATVKAGSVESLEAGRSRAELIQHLIDLADEDPDLVVGLDFAFSFPRWYFADQKLESVQQLWELAAVKGEEWLSDCNPPFWGRAAPFGLRDSAARFRLARRRRRPRRRRRVRFRRPSAAPQPDRRAASARIWALTWAR